MYKAIKLSIFFLLSFQFSFSQNFIEWELVTDEGEKSVQLLTGEGYINLLQPISIGDLGGLTSELVDQRTTIVELKQKNDYLEDKILLLEKKIMEISLLVEGGNSGDSGLDVWAKFKDDLLTLSKSKFKSEYTEIQLVEVAKTRPLLPDFLKTTEGKVSEKRNWYQDNKSSIDQY